MKYPKFNPQEFEKSLLSYWKENETVEKLRLRNKAGKKFYFLQGPPYTSGNIHLGHAWNFALKDMVLRYKRMKGFNVWDRNGYDMHGLPTEQKVMKKFGLKNKDDIEKFGVENFVKECEKFCKEVMAVMDIDFQRIGSTLDFKNPYQPIKPEFMDAEWWLIKKAHEKNRLYRGLRTMHWDAATGSAVAKHELEYKSVKDTAIFVKFKRFTAPNSYFIIWTTTPWTIPLNLAIMVNPEMTYVEVEVITKAGDNEIWVLAEELKEAVLEKAKIEKHTVLKTFNGTELEGEKYEHPLGVLEHMPKEMQENENLFTVLLSKEYVDASAGTGLVHCAPGCGPEDYEVGHKNGIPPFNCVNEEGFFEDFGEMTGMKAKTDDLKFIMMIHDKGALIAKESYVHDYPYGERSHEPVIFRTTKQWFFKVEDLKDQMLQANEDTYWYPESGKNAFRSWLEHLRDNSITKQRYWGTPVPIWMCDETEEYIVVGSIKELEELSGTKVDNLHIPWIDEITIEKDGKTFKRVPDVLDVWIDAGTSSWNCLDYPSNPDLLEEWFPADFILEGKDQIRGWYNLLMIASMLGFGKPSFKNVYMHGFVTDVEGTKMSKSLGNITSPYEIIDKHGADTLRYYMCQTTAGEDVSFSWDELKVKNRYLNIVWNLHNLLLNLAKDHDLNPFTLKVDQTKLGREEKFILSRLHSTIKKVTQMYDKYQLDILIKPIEDLFLELSRTYIQLVREKMAQGSKEEKEMTANIIATVFLETLKMFSTIAPFISEAMYLNLKEVFSLEEESISAYMWPECNEGLINENLEAQFSAFNVVLQAGLHAREKANQGVRWPMKELIVVSHDDSIVSSSEELRDLLKQQLNIKDLNVLASLPNAKVSVKADFKKLGPVYGPLTQKIVAEFNQHDGAKVVLALESDGEYSFTIEGKEVTILPDYVTIEREAPEGFVGVDSRNVSVYLNTLMTPELELEGFVREVTRKVQALRKDAGLEKKDSIKLTIESPLDLAKFSEEICAKVGAVELEFVSVEGKEHMSEFKVKGKEFKIGFDLC
jgi:isoleucyl-tRNA synthetase